MFSKLAQNLSQRVLQGDGRFTWIKPTDAEEVAKAWSLARLSDDDVRFLINAFITVGRQAEADRLRDMIAN